MANTSQLSHNHTLLRRKTICTSSSRRAGSVWQGVMSLTRQGHWHGYDHIVEILKFSTGPCSTLHTPHTLPSLRKNQLTIRFVFFQKKTFWIKCNWFNARLLSSRYMLWGPVQGPGPVSTQIITLTNLSLFTMFTFLMWMWMLCRISFKHFSFPNSFSW